MGVVKSSVCEPATSNLSSVLLDSYLGRGISEICAHGYTDDDLNHCAHFVCHVMNIATGSTTCRAQSQTGVANKIGVCIRVQELFASCPRLGLYDGATQDQLTNGGFVFVTAKNVVDLKAKRMTNIPRKHVGIGLNDTIWHYSNTLDKVVTATPAAFRRHYAGQDNGLYFGTFPANAIASSFGCGR